LQLVNGAGGETDVRIIENSERVIFNFTNSGWQSIVESSKISALGGRTLTLNSIGENFDLYRYIVM